MKLEPGPELDRRLAEELGIDPEFKWRLSNGTEFGLFEYFLSELDAKLAAQDWPCEAVHIDRVSFYPALSTSGDGMLLLMSAMERLGFRCLSGVKAGGVYGSTCSRGHGIFCGDHITRPGSFAYAAAVALGMNPEASKPEAAA